MKLQAMTNEDSSLCSALATHDTLALLLDLDGTLIPFAPTIDAAVLDDAGAALLRALRSAGIHVVIASGRPRAHVDSLRTLVDGIVWLAEHGSWKCTEDVWIGPPTAHELEELVGVFAPFTTIPGARLEPKSQSLCIHWRLVPQALKEDLIAGCELACDEWLESHPEFERLDGVEMLEVRLRTANKSRAVTWVRENLPGARIIAIGDDHTDEDMFAALRADELAIGVGPNRIRARCELADTVAVRGFLQWLVDTRRAGHTVPFPALESRRPATTTLSSRLLVVSNRIPPQTNGRERPVGGLVSALEPALRSHEGVWLGWSGGETDGDRKLTIDDESLPIRASFEFAPSWRDRFYGGFCNRALWPLFHGFPSRVKYSDADWIAYVAANKEFARHAYDLVAADGTIWLHDYHLLLAARELRARGFGGPIGLFLHIPFPSRDLFDTLPWADEIASAMLDLDLVGFHTEQWATNFEGCIHARGRTSELPAIGVLPIGVDPVAFQIEPGSVDREVDGLRTAIAGRKLILGVDRLDYSKGIPERLIAFERLLEASPNWRGNVSFVQVSVPSREEVPEYAELRHHVENLVGRINGKFGEADWVPVRYLYRSYDHRLLAGLYRLADVGLVTPLRDGLNLVAKEFVVAQDAADPGVLVLSRFAGAAEELRDAVLTNPFHPEGLASDIDRALRMDLVERTRRHECLSMALANKTPQRWASTFLDRLASVRATC